jgi:hypothetical protein
MKCAVFTSIFLLILTSVQLIPCSADNVSSLESRIEAIMNNGRLNLPFDGFTAQELKTVDPNHFLSILERYEDDEAWVVRRLTYRYEYLLAQVQPQPKLKQRIVKRLVNASVTGREGLANRWLLTFAAKDFNDDSKQMLRQALKRDKVNRGHVLICGVAQMEDQLPVLEKMLIDEVKHQAKVERGEEGFDWYYTTGWTARLARARMGVKEDITKCLQLVETVEDLDRRVGTLLRDVGYIRQAQTIEHLQKYLESDKRLSPVSPPVPGKPVASRALDILIDCLKDFPVARKPGRGYKWEQIEQARKWMAEQKQKQQQADKPQEKQWDIIR